MTETEPNYITKLREHLDSRFDDVKKDINDLAIMTANQFKEVDATLYDMDTRIYSVETSIGEIKEDVGRIRVYIGGYEIRMQNLEKRVFA